MLSLNVGNIDRAIRLIGGLTLVLLAATGRIGPWGYVGVIPLVTGAFAWCPLYRLLGVTTTAR